MPRTPPRSRSTTKKSSTIGITKRKLKDLKFKKPVIFKKRDGSPTNLDIISDSASHILNSVRKGVKKFSDPFFTPEDLRVQLSAHEYTILQRIHDLQVTRPGNILAAEGPSFDPKNIDIDLNYETLQELLSKDDEERSQSDKDHGKKPPLWQEIDYVNRKLIDQEIKQLKIIRANYHSNKVERIYYLYNLLKNLKNRETYSKGEIIGNYHRFEGDEDDIKEFIENGKMKVQLGDLVCEAQNCKEDTENDMEIVETTSRSRTGGKRKSKTRKRNRK